MVARITQSARTYQSVVEEQLRQLIGFLKLQDREREVVGLFRALTSDCLSFPTTVELPPISTICSDSTPFQHSIVLEGGSQHALRYVTEMCTAGMCLPERVTFARRHLPQILGLIGAEKVQPTLEALLDFLFPVDRLTEDLPSFGIWFGAQHMPGLPPELKVYCNLLDRFGDPWRRLEESMKLLCTSSPERSVRDLMEFFGESCRPRALGFHCHSSGAGNLRFYLRGYSLTRSDITGFCKKNGFESFLHAYLQFSRLVLGGAEEYAPRSTVFSLEVNPQGEVVNPKAEFGPLYYVAKECEIHSCVDRFANEFDLDTRPYEFVLDLLGRGKDTPLGRFHDVVGIGTKDSDHTQVTIYLRPDLRRCHQC